MPFGLAPAPAEMQSYVATVFGDLRDEHGWEFVVPRMDDLKVSSATLDEHIGHLCLLCTTASRRGFEFKLTKGQYNQPEIEFWGCICDGRGRRAQPRKVQQLAEWPEPVSIEGLTSFLAFVNYLREYMDPEWIRWEQVLRPLRKKGADFGLWSGIRSFGKPF